MRNVISSKDFWQWLKSHISQEDCRQVSELFSIVRTVVMVGTHVSGGEVVSQADCRHVWGCISVASGGDCCQRREQLSGMGIVVSCGDCHESVGTFINCGNCHQWWELSAVVRLSLIHI